MSNLRDKILLFKKKAENDAFLVFIYESKAGQKDEESFGDITTKKRPSFWNWVKPLA